MRIKINPQYIYSIAVVYMLSFPALLSLGNEILNLFGLYTALDTMLLYGILVCLVLAGGILSIIDRDGFRIDVFAVLVFFGASYLFSYLLLEENSKYIFTSLADYSKNPVFLFFVYSMPAFLLVRKLREYDLFFSFMKKFSYIVVALSVFVFFFSTGSSATQYMTFSYNMLTQLLWLVGSKPEKYKFLHYALVIVGAFVLCVGGSRGAMLFFVFGCLAIYFISYKLTIKNFIISFIAVFGVFSFSLFKDFFLGALSKLLEVLSIDSRNFSFLMVGSLIDEETEMRIPLYEDAMSEVGIIGKGIMGDRVHLGFYPHNIILEILIHFGWVLGTILCCLLIFIIIKGIMKRNRPEFMFIILLLPCGFLKLLLTGSYLNQEPAFFALIGFCINAILRENENENTIDKYAL